jgi:Transposase DDE domain
MTSYPTRSGSFQHVLRSFLQDDGTRFREVLTEDQIERAARLQNLSFGTGKDDIYSLPLTLWAFVTQAASESKSCLAAVARVLAWLTSQGRQVCDAGTGAYCKARAKLTELFLWFLLCDVGRQLEEEAPEAWRWHGKRVVLVDGSTLSMPDTPANQKAYPQSRSQRPGVGFPIMRWVALLGLTTGAVLDSAFGPYRGKQTGETALFRTLLKSLRQGDVILADRYYCSYWLVALLLAEGVDVVFRKHHLRHTDFRRGCRLGNNDHVVTWSKPKRPEWMDQATYDALPETLALREVRTQLTTPGSRVKELIVVTTLCDSEIYSKAEILDLYHERWHAEIDLRSIKIQMKMEILRCKTPEMVRKEIWAHLLAYNLIRKVMAQAALAQQLTPRQISFAGAMQTLNEFRTHLLQASADELSELTRRILAAIARHRVGNRPGRCEPRKVKRRPKGYSRLLVPRAEERAKLMRGQRAPKS